LNFAGKSDVRNQNGVGGLNYTLSPTLLTDARFAFTRYRVKVLPLDYGKDAAETAASLDESSQQNRYLRPAGTPGREH